MTNFILSDVVSIPLASESASGLLSSDDKVKINGISANAQANPQAATSDEVSALVETSVRLFSPAQFKSAIDAYNQVAATSAATPGKIAIRDGNGRIQAASPISEEDVANKGYISIQASSYEGDISAKIVTYSAPGTYVWTKPNCAFIRIICSGAGAGGGSGSSGSGDPGTGGAAGGGGGRTERTFSTEELPDTVTITVPSGGIGGVGAISGVGNPGGAASGPTSFGALTDPWYVVAYPGGYGASGGAASNAGSGAGGSPTGAGQNGSGASAGSATAGASSGVATGSSQSSSNGGTGGGSGGNGTYGGSAGAATYGSSGGGGGAGLSGGNTVYMGGSVYGVIPGYLGVLSGGTAGGGQSPKSSPPPGGILQGRGGPGGASSITGEAGRGADGGFPGGGGGGGGASLSPNKSGGGGNGGDGCIHIMSWGKKPPKRDVWITGYYPSWENTNGLLISSKINFNYITHVNFFSAIPAANGTLNINFDIDSTAGPALASDVTGRAHAAGKKAIMVVGGAGRSSNFDSASTGATLATFVSNIMAAKNSMGFDGVDIDWEPISDYTKFTSLIQALRAADSSMLLTVASPQINVNYQTANSAFAQISAYVDRINIMTYDMAYNGTGWYSWHNSPLTGEGSHNPTSVKSSVAAYITAGVPAGKLGVGSGFYGSGWNGVTAPGQDVTSATKVGSDVSLSYKNIMANYYNPSAYRWDSVARVPYLSFASPTGSVGATYISYEDPRSILEKMNYIRENGLGSVIIWTMGEAHLADDSQPLLKAMYDYINIR